MSVACIDFQRPCRWNTISLTTRYADIVATPETQRVRPALGRVSLNALQVPSESFSHSAVTNRLIRGYRLKESSPLEMGLKIRSVGSRETWSLARYLLRSLIGHAQLGSPEKTTFSPQQNCMVVLTFEDLNNHEYLISSYPEDIVEPKEAGKWQNTQGNIAQFNWVIKVRTANLISHESK